MDDRKNLANCDPIEFLEQAYRIKESAEKWMKATDILNIRSKKVEGLEIISPDTPEEEAEKIREKNKSLVSAQARKNASEIFNAIFRDHPKETVELLGLICFVEPEHIREHKISWYLANIGDILTDSDTLDFFTSLAQLEQIGFLKL